MEVDEEANDKDYVQAAKEESSDDELGNVRMEKNSIKEEDHEERNHEDWGKNPRQDRRLRRKG